MIRLAAAEDFPSVYPTESALRIGALKEAYGIRVPFIQFYTDGEGSLLSVMDSVGVLYAAKPLTEEWLTFLNFHPDIRRLHSDADTGQRLAAGGNWHIKTGVVLEYKGEISPDAECVEETPPLQAVHMLLSGAFEEFPPFDAWYVDVSHRVRHGHCRLAAIMEEGRPVSVAMTVAEAGRGVLLGQVATDPAFRCKGYAGRCIRSLIQRTQGKDLYILPANKTAESLYLKLGFRPCDHWAELQRL